MTAVTTIADLSRPLALLRLLTADHPELPALNIAISPNVPGRLDLAVHNDLAAFEAWREALGIDSGAVRHNLQSGDTTVVLTAAAEIADARVNLVGYSRNMALLTAVAA
ncbi:hypothetical protein [Streptomyces sp. NPDC050704]|uniref:hypothetical protein n=1 Tax=Streptomyces sp. NPDC050704 TaxID=3157219 RepID=UPI00342CF81F